jgi:diacylglycerol kinase (ATP)
LKNAVLISNPLAGIKDGRRSHQIHAAATILRKSGIETAITFTSHPGDGERLARTAVEKGCGLVIVCGGDGTINEVVNGIAPAQIPLAILPGGTANIVAKELGLPGRIVKAARQLPSWEPCRVSLGRAMWEESDSLQQRYFLAVAGIGFDAHIISQLNLPMKHRVGVLAYGWEAVRQTWRYGFPRFQCDVNGSTASATFVVVQRSSRYAGWLHLAQAQSLRASDFSLCTFKSSDRTRYFQYALAVLTRTHHRLRDVSLFRGSSVRCISENPEEVIYFEVDGERAGRLPVTFEVVADALTLLAPRSFTSVR